MAVNGARRRTNTPTRRRLFSVALWCLGGLLTMLSLHHCAVPREFPAAPLSQTEVLYEPAITYQSLKDTIATRCVSCHSKSSAEGSYDMSSYAGLRGPGSDGTANAIPGDAQSLLLTTLRADATVEAHRPSSADEADGGFVSQLRRWVIAYRMAYFRSSVHTSDIHLPGTTGFHGALIQKEKWDWSACTRCHGEDLSGGASGVSCIKCHDTRTADGCSSCHTTVPSKTGSFRSPSTQSGKTGALHQRHFGDALAKGATCQTCHPVPSALRDGTHLDGQIQLKLSGAAAYHGATPRWQAATKSCTGTYCHGAGLDGAKAPVWAPVAGATACQSCHAMPPRDLRSGGLHPNDKTCGKCHPSAHMDQDQIKTPSLHINGQVELSFQGDCSSCHGDADSPAPPRDLQGNTETTAMGVGAHRAHAQSDQKNPRHQTVPCSACHKVPGDTFSKGHIDTDGPAEVIFQGLAALGGLSPRWDRDKGSCSQVYCHGASLDGGKYTAPVWNQVGTGQASCDGCHGMPPQKLRSGDSHTPSKECHLCHKNINADGTFSQPALHINGRVDL